MMNAAALLRALEEIGISQSEVSVGEPGEQRWCIVGSEDGYDVFWMERGNRNRLHQFQDFEEAAYFLLGHLTYSQLVAGAVGLLNRTES